MGLGLTIGVVAPAVAQVPSPATQVARRKALFIEQFTRLVEWPEGALRKDEPFVLCVLGKSATAEELVNLAERRRFKDRPSDMRRPRQDEDLRSCHLIYIAANEAEWLGNVLRSIEGAPVLTVGDTRGFGERGLHLNLFEETRTRPRPGTYVGFELNVDAVRNSSLSFDPQLLSQGRQVHSQGSDAGQSEGSQSEEDRR